MVIADKMKILIVIIFSLFTYSLSSYCGSYIPKDESTCDKFTNSTSICCYLQGSFSGAPHSMCYPFDRDYYYSLQRSIELNGYRYKLNCGSKRGALCGQVVNPITYKDCSIYSKKSNSCCFYQYKSTTNCVWLGTSSIGEMKYKDLTVICQSIIMKFNIFILLVLMTIIF